MRRLKKATAIALAVVMMFSTVVVGNTVQAENVSAQSTEYTPITVGQMQTVSITGEGQIAYFSFTPEESGVYIFQSSSAGVYCDTCATVYQVTPEGMERVASDDDSGLENNFSLSYSYVAGETYILEARPYDSSFVGEFNVILTEPPIESIVMKPISIIEKTDGYWSGQGTENEYYYYHWYDSMEYTITMKNGDIVEGKGSSFEYNGQWHSFSWSGGQSSSSPWTIGNTYSQTVKVLDYETTVDITIVETPVQSIVVQPISIIENTCGFLEKQGTDDEYYYYNWHHNMDFVITLKNGQIITGNNTWGFDYNNEWMNFSWNNIQTSSTPWTKGNTYTQTLSALGYETTVDVSITASPIQSIVVQPISIMENSTGYLQNQGTDDEYYHYWWHHKMDFVITMKDGQVITGENTTSFDYNNEWYNFSWNDIQSSSTPWTLGHTYTQTVSALGYETTVDVSIIDTPIQSVVVEPISIMEGTTGSLWHEGTQDQFYYYNWNNAIRNYTITMKDGTVHTGTHGAGGFQYDEEWYHFNLEDDQETNHWTAGNTYAAKASIMGYSVYVDVTITESPVESIVVEPMTLAEHTNGYWYGAGPGGPISGTDSWYYYRWNEQLQYTVTLKDGGVIQGRGMGVSVDGQYYGFSWNDTQYDEHWYAGNTYTTSISCMGKRVDVTVSICEMNQTDGYEYLVQDGCAIIIGCSKEDAILNIPSEIDGYPVIGITDLTYAMEYAEELVIPDSVTMLSGSIFEWNYDLKKLTIGKGISNIYNEMFIGATCLEEIIVSEENPYYCSVDGVVYDKEMGTLVVFPRAKEGAYTVPDTVTNIDCLIDNIAYYNVQLDLGNSETGYVVEDGVIYNADKTVIYACDRTKTGKYVMPDTVITINEGAFQKCSFSEVVVSENISEIVYAAFSYSMELEKVVLPEKLKTIDWGAFSECEKLAEADLPSGLEELGDRAFWKTGITDVTIPGTVTEVGYGAYKESQVAELTLEEGIEVIWSSAFANTQLKNVVIPDSITHIGGYVFTDTPLESATIGTGLEAISDYAFANTKLTSVTIPENIAEIGEYAFANSMLEEAIIEKNDVYIYEGAFYNCPLKEIDLKDGVVAISDYAFYGNQAESIVIPDSVTDVTYKSFAESKKLLDIDVPDDLVSIDGTAFDGTAWWDVQEDGVVYLENYLYGYKGKMPADTEITVKDGTTLIAAYTFNNEYNLKTLSIPGSVKNIGDCALGGCLSLEKVTVAEDNELYFTNEEGTILYDQNKNAVWKKVEEVLWLNIDTYVRYGKSVEEWLANDPHQWVDVKYIDGNYGSESCVVTADMISGYDSTKLGYQTVTVDFGKFTCETEIYIDMPVVESIKVSKLPNKTKYDINQSFRPTGMVVSGVTADGTEIEIQDANLYDIYGFDSSEAGTKTITVVYDDLTATFEVEVTAERITHAASTTSGGTNIEISSATDAVEEGATLVVDERLVEDLQDEVEVPEIFTQNNSQIFDIRFEKEVETGFEVVQPKEAVEVRIPVPEGMDGRNSKVYHITDGEPVDMKAVYSDGYMVFDTPHFSYYGLVEDNGSSISGLVDYASAVTGDVTLTLMKDSEVCDTVTAIDGAYNFTGLSDGTYTVKIEKTGHAAREYEVVVEGESVEQDGQIRLMGDINGDGIVDVLDANQITLHARGVTLLSGYEYDCANIDGDEEVNVIDANSVILHVRGREQLW